MATQPKPEQSTDEPFVTRLTGVETRLTGVETRLTGVETRLTGVETRLTGVETRLTGVETRLTGVETDLAVVKSNYATQADILKLEIQMAQMETRLIKWFIGTAITLSAVVGTIAFAVARFIH